MGGARAMMVYARFGLDVTMAILLLIAVKAVVVTHSPPCPRQDRQAVVRGRLVC